MESLHDLTRFGRLLALLALLSSTRLLYDSAVRLRRDGLYSAGVDWIESQGPLDLTIVMGYAICSTGADGAVNQPCAV